MVSIHAPRVGCDDTRPSGGGAIFQFQFTHPVWGATLINAPDDKLADVSIHAPRVGCDHLR